MKLNSLTDLFIAELHDLLSAERQILQMLPKIIRTVSHSELREALEAHFGCAAHELVMVGDRYLTDVLFGNRHGLLTARPAPFAPRGDAGMVRAARALEDAMVRRWLGRGAAPPRHRLLPLGEDEQRRSLSSFVRT